MAEKSEEKDCRIISQRVAPNFGMKLLTGSIARSTITSSQVSELGKSIKEDLYFIRQSHSAAASLVGTRSRAVTL